MPRKRATERQVIAVLLSQGAVIPCYRCKIALTAGEAVEREHVVPLALDGTDEPENWRYSHKECHARQTNGSRATSYGSDKHAIAKGKRLARGPRQRKGKAIPGRGFDRKLRKRMDGTVEIRK